MYSYHAPPIKCHCLPIGLHHLSWVTIMLIGVEHGTRRSGYALVEHPYVERPRERGNPFVGG